MPCLINSFLPIWIWMAIMCSHILDLSSIVNTQIFGELLNNSCR